ncbi:hypothetical protein PN437_07390 [Microcystis aeruginosa CS-564/01]|uniref:hypothetical protein n=1 Tax=Microcystis aeruginosa TaxID=1126 RepID=UPI00232EF3BC|nr:hypothetical protein [Microcystis aeruginosa]MDB9424727.1 hypothetical protein [Microcystis aeruginosa CS-564/01]
MLSTLLSKAVQKAQELPEAIQDELAEQFIEDIENEIKWQETLSALLGLVGKMYSKIHSFWRASGRNHKDTKDTKIDRSSVS